MNGSRVIGTTDEAIRAAEAELQRPLPASFAAWLRVNNGKALGGLHVYPVFDARDPRKTWDSIARHFHHGWQAWLDNFAHETVDFGHLLPFAEFGTGDCYCFDYATQGIDGEPPVVLWSHETGRTERVADSFAAFLASRDRPA